MIQEEYSFKDLSFSSKLIRDLIDGREELFSLINTPFNLSQLGEQIKQKKFCEEGRKKLVTAIQQQNSNIELSSLTSENIQALSASNSYTITTGHQLNLLTGPLYSIYKIAQVIVIAQEAKKLFPENHFVPVFWMATEDHDFEEINHIHLFGDQISWEGDGIKDKVVGRIETNSIQQFIDRVLEKYQDEEKQLLIKTITNHYLQHNTLASAHRAIVNVLFNEYGIVIIDGDDPQLKQSFTSIAKQEVLDGFVYEQVGQANLKLDELNYHQQVFVRDCNLFYINDAGVRFRIEKEDEKFKLEDSWLSKEDLITLIEQSPEKFSPNALMRPMYQEKILPNLLYVGGGGEIAYWLQLKAAFERVDLTFPLLRVRDSLLLLTEKMKAQFAALEVDLKDLKENIDLLVKNRVVEQSESDLQLTDAQVQIMKAKSMIFEKVHSVNPGLEQMVEAEFVKMIKAIERIEEKLIKAEKGKHDQLIKNLKKLQQLVYPNGGFQERYENFLPYFLNNNHIISDILSNLTADPKPKIKILTI